MAKETRNYASTRLYGMDGAPVMRYNDNLARKVNEAYEPERHREQPRPVPHGKPEIKKRVKAVPLTAEELKKRVLVTVSAFLVGAMLFAMVWSFAAVANAYAGVNALTGEIEATQGRINDLSLQVEQSVDVNGIIHGAEESGYALPDAGTAAQP